MFGVILTYGLIVFQFHRGDETENINNSTMDFAT